MAGELFGHPQNMLFKLENSVIADKTVFSPQHGLEEVGRFGRSD